MYLLASADVENTVVTITAMVVDFIIITLLINFEVILEITVTQACVYVHTKLIL
jgi:hypothetical protein